MLDGFARGCAAIGMLAASCTLNVAIERRDSGGDGGGDSDSPDLQAGKGLRGDYFADKALSGGAWSFFRIDPDVDFSWGGGSPDPRIPVDSFSVRWTGYLTADSSEAYTLYVHSDDGVRLFVADQRIVDQFYLPAGQDFSGTVQLSAGEPVLFKAEYYENTGDAAIRIEWSSPTVPRQVIPRSHFTPP